MKPPTVFLGEMTNPEVEAFLKKHHTVIVPTGATEQHGPHGPLLTDVLIPQEIARRIAPRIGAVVAPPINYALSYPHAGFTGLVQIRIPTFMALIDDLCVSFAASGFKRIIFLNGHYDNTYAIAYGCATAADKLSKDVKAFPVNYWDALTAEEIAEFSGLKNGLHANLAETSAVLGINPDLVDMDKANAEFPPFPDYTINTGPGAHRVFLHRAGFGVLGDEVGHVGRCAQVQPGSGGALSRGRRALDARGPGEHRGHVQGDAAPLRVPRGSSGFHRVPQGSLFPVEENAVEERRRRPVHRRDDDVARLLERQPQRVRDLAEHGRASLCRNTPPGASMPATLLIASISSDIVEVRQDVRGDDEIERRRVETLGDDVERGGRERPRRRLADAHGLAQVTLRERGDPTPGRIVLIGNGFAELREVLAIVGGESDGVALPDFADERQHRRIDARSGEMVHDPRVDVGRHDLQFAGA